MRPVKKGSPPTIYKQYGDAKIELTERLGLHCCYCEQSSKFENMAVEHVFPKERHPCLKLCWSNFLLSCTLCNSKKGCTDIFYHNVNNYIFPDRDDTYHQIAYPKTTGYLPKVDPSVNNPQKVQNTLNLFMKPYKNPTAKQIRIVTEQATKWKEAGDSAERKRNFYLRLRDENLKVEYVEQINESAKNDCWSIWMRQFEDILEIKEVILFALPNTAIEYFIDNYWEHKEYFKEYHSTTSYFNRLITILKSRISYIKSHQTKLSQIQKDGIFEWMIEFIANVKQKVTFTQDQLIRIQGDVNELKSL